MSFWTESKFKDLWENWEFVNCLFSLFNYKCLILLQRICNVSSVEYVIAGLTKSIAIALVRPTGPISRGLSWVAMLPACVTCQGGLPKYESSAMLESVSYWTHTLLHSSKEEEGYFVEVSVVEVKSPVHLMLIDWCVFLPKTRCTEAFPAKEVIAHKEEWVLLKFLSPATSVAWRVEF